MLTQGSTAPDFKGVDQHGMERSMKDYANKKLVLFFYPKASTGGCTKEVKNFQKNIDELQNQGFALLGVSADDQDANNTFSYDNNLSFPLLCDVNREVIKAYGADQDGKTKRITYVIENNKISRVIDKVDVDNASEQILR
ncbi:MAG: peroxiredoxin [Solitalea-like symbiont of Tyrophagus putrescentiae]